MCVCVYIYGDQGIVCGNWFYSIIWVAGTELTWASLAESAFTHWATSEIVCAFICYFGPGSFVCHFGTHCVSVCTSSPVCKFHEIPKAEDIVSALRGKKRLPVIKNYVHMHLFKKKPSQWSPPSSWDLLHSLCQASSILLRQSLGLGT